MSNIRKILTSLSGITLVLCFLVAAAPATQPRRVPVQIERFISEHHTEARIAERMRRFLFTPGMSKGEFWAMIDGMRAFGSPVDIRQVEETESGRVYLAMIFNLDGAATVKVYRVLLTEKVVSVSLSRPPAVSVAVPDHVIEYLKSLYPFEDR